MKETEILMDFISGKRPKAEFYEEFEGKYSKEFDPDTHLKRIGVVNQTTMLASETQAIADRLKQQMIELYGIENLKDHFADTRDTLCYATNDNQQATFGVLEQPADLALVVGGYNSSNTSHIVELCEEKLPTYFIKSAEEIESRDVINHFNYPEKKMEQTANWLPEKGHVRIVLTSGASCPDSVVDRVLQRVVSFFDKSESVEKAVESAIAGIQ
jgi:4-hydroxy-3-methylbut-2-enyl diphosphate reductase